MLKAYYIGLRDAFSLKFLLFLFVSQFFIKGTLYRIATGVFLPIFKEMNVDAVHVQLYMTLAMAPWSIKPLIGVVSDLLSIFGYHKRFYLVISILVGFASGFSLIFIPQNISVSVLIVLCFFGLNFEISICDLLSEGTYARLMNENPQTGTDIITLVNGFQMAGQLIALCFVGPLSDIKSFLPIFIIGTIICIVPLIPTMLGWLPEEKNGNKIVSINWELFHRSKLPLAIVAVTGLSGPLLAILTIYVNNIVGLVCAFIMVSLSIAGSYIAFPKLVGHVALFQVITQASKPSLGSALDFFFTADEECIPGGPAFTFKYYITYTGILGTLMTVVATIMYQKWMSTWKFRTVLIFTAVLAALGGISDLLIVLRVNVAMGISDKVFYVFGEAILENVGKKTKLVLFFCILTLF